VVDSSPAQVVLLHGLGRTSGSMLLASRHLRRAGFNTVRIGYPSLRLPIGELAALVAAKLPRDEAPIHFLTHSLGGVIVRYIAKHHRPNNLGRVVMLGPPNKGSKLASKMRRHWYYRLTTGPAGQQLHTGPDSIPNQLGPVDFELGVIASAHSADPFSRLIGNDNDGKVTLEETKVDGMTDWVTVRRGHTWQMMDPAVLNHAVHFLRHGMFAAE
jgi:triacylglycerol lipase